MATHSSVLAWRIPGTGEPGGLLSMGSHRVRHDWSDLATAASSSMIKQNLHCSYSIHVLYMIIHYIHSHLFYLLLLPVCILAGVLYIVSVQFSHSVTSDFLWPHGLQDARLPCPSPTPRACSNSWPFSWWYHPTISCSVIPFFSGLQSLSAWGSFQMS